MEYVKISEVPSSVIVDQVLQERIVQSISLSATPSHAYMEALAMILTMTAGVIVLTALRRRPMPDQ